MIKIIQNESFPDWVQLIAFNNFVEEFDSKRKALRVAKKLAKENNIGFLSFLGSIVPTE
jgi:hypothetical protein